MRGNLWKNSGPGAFPFDHVTYNHQADDLLSLAGLLQTQSGTSGAPFSESARRGIQTKLQSLAPHLAKPPDISFLEAHWRLFDNGNAIYKAYVESETCADFLKRYGPLREEMTHLTNVDSVLGIDGLALACDGSVAARDAREIDRNDPMPELERYLAQAKSPASAQSDRVEAFRLFAGKWDRFQYWITEAIMYDNSPILERWGDRLQQASQIYQWPEARLLGLFVKAAALNIEANYAEALRILEGLAANPEAVRVLGNMSELQRIRALAGVGRAEDSFIAQERLSESGWRTTLQQTGLDFSVVAASAELARLDRLSADGKLTPAYANRRIELLNTIAQRRGAARTLPSADEIRKAIAGIGDRIVALRYGEVGKNLYLWRIDGSGVSLRRLDGTAHLTIRLAFRLSWLLREHRKGWENLAAELHRILIPLGSIPPGKRVIVIGADLLGAIPFEVLGPQDGMRLLNTNAISYSRGLYGRSTLQAAQTIPPDEAVFVGVNTEGLSNAESEAVQIAGLVGAKSSTGLAASREDLERGLANKRWVHFATHGALVPNDIWASYLSIYGAQHIELWELLKYFNASVVVLSACDTFRGTTTPSSGGEFGSIGQLTLAAGAQLVMATLWRVDDQIIGRLMVDFYKRNGLASTDFALALQAAKQQAASLYKDPFYYASVVAWTDGIPISH
jgi:hypothetical protein